jgi:hypothetical protein
MAAGLGFKDFTTGEVLTAADVDGYLMQGVWVFASAAARDAAVTSPQEGNFAYLKDTNVTTYYTGSAWATLGGAASFVGCSVYKDTTAQTLSNATDTIITYNAEEFDTDGFHDNSVNNSRITIPSGKGGKYLILASITFAANASGIREMLFSVNGSTAVLAFAQAPTSASSFRSSASCIKNLTAGDYVEVQAAQSSGGNLNVNAGVTQTRFGVVYLGA